MRFNKLPKLSPPGVLRPSWTPAQIGSACTLWLDSTSGVTIDANNRVSAWASRVGSISFTQSTDGNKPLLGRGDNKENLIAMSDSLTTSPWTAGSNVTIAAQAFLETAATGAHYVSQAQARTVGLAYIFSVDVKSTGGRNCWIGDGANGAFFNLSTGAYISATGTITTYSSSDLGSSWYRVSVTIPTVAAAGIWYVYATSGTTLSYAGDITKGLEVKRVQLRSSLSDSDYLANALATSQYRGVNGITGIHFDGVDDVMTSSSALSTIFAQDAKTIFASIYPNITTARTLITDSTPRFSFGIGTNTAAFMNNDGAADTSTQALSTATSHIIMGLHSAGNIYTGVDNTISGATSSGNTSSLTGTLIIGGTTQFNGRLVELVATNTALDADTRTQLYNYLARRWLGT